MTDNSYREALARLSKDELIEILVSFADNAEITIKVLEAASFRERGTDSVSTHTLAGVVPCSNDLVQQKNRIKNHRNFDMSKYRKRHIAVQLQYNGQRYSGFAAQSGEHDDTVEKNLFLALEKVRLIQNRETCAYSRCGRTDRGVSALGQVVAFNLRSAFPLTMLDEDVPTHPHDTRRPENPKESTEQINSPAIPVIPSSLSPKVNELDASSLVKKQKGDGNNIVKPIRELDYCGLLNKALPEDIRVLGWTEVTCGFSARFSATDRTYKYFFIRKDLDICAMNAAAALLVGEHDFRNLCKLDVANVSNFRREIFSAEVKPFAGDGAGEQDDETTVYVLQIRGVAFLWHMVRCVMAVLMLVGEGREAPDIVSRLLDIETVTAKPDYRMADENPLVLHDSGYDNLQMQFQARNLMQLNHHMEAIWERHVIAAAQTRNVLQFLEGRRVRSDEVADLLSSLGIPSTVSAPLEDDAQDAHNDAKKMRMDVADPLLMDSRDRMAGEQSADQRWVSWSVVRRAIREHQRYSARDYKPLMQRPCAESYEQRVKHISGGRKRQFEKHMDAKRSGNSLPQESKQSDESESFFVKMRRQGSKLATRLGSV